MWKEFREIFMSLIANGPSKNIMKEIMNDLVIFSDIISTSKGRDKMFSLAQYLIELYI